MINMKHLALGAYQTNCYLVWDETSPTCVVIDPGYEPDTVLAEAKKLGKEIAAIFLTHGHFDHVGGEVLVVSQFTLYGNCRKGRRPSFVGAAGPELGNALYEKFLQYCTELGYPPQHGEFGAHMEVESINDGPVTILLDTAELMDTPRHK